MAKKVSQLTAAGTLTGAETLPVVQGGSTRKTTLQAIADLGGGGGGSASTFDVTANGAIGGELTVSFSSKAIVPGEFGGSPTFSAEIGDFASFNYNANSPGGYGGYGDYTTATSLSFGAKYLMDMSFNGSTVVTSLSFPEAVAQSSNMGGINVSGSALTSVSFAKLESSTGITFNQCQSLVNVSFPSLKTMTGWGGLNIYGVCHIPGFTSSNFPSLKVLKSNIYEPGYFETVDLPSVKTHDNFYIASSGNQSGASIIKTFKIPNVVSHNSSIQISNRSTLTNVIIGTVGTFKVINSSPYYEFSNCALTQASVDNILTVLASLDGTNGTSVPYTGSVLLSGGTNAAPSAAGLAAKATLVARGWQISNN